MTLSGGSKYEFQAEMFVKSLEMYGKTPFCLTICQNPNEKLKSSYLRKKADVITHSFKFTPEWYGGLASCPQKGDVTIFTDTDMLVMNDLSPITIPALKSVCGVIAYQSPFSNRTEWDKLFDGCGVPLPKLDCETNYDKKKVPYYFNLGFVAMPSKWVLKINEKMADHINNCNEIIKGHYHIPQFALCLSLAALNLPCRKLPIKCNYPDLYGDIIGVDEVIVAHLLRTKSKIQCLKNLKNPELPKSQIINHIVNKMKFISNINNI